MPSITPAAMLSAALHSFSSLQYVFTSSADGAVAEVAIAGVVGVAVGAVGAVAVVLVVAVVAVTLAGVAAGAAAGLAPCWTRGSMGLGLNATYAFFLRMVLLMYRSHSNQLSYPSFTAGSPLESLMARTAEWRGVEITGVIRVCEGSLSFYLRISGKPSEHRAHNLQTVELRRGKG